MKKYFFNRTVSAFKILGFIPTSTTGQYYWVDLEGRKMGPTRSVKNGSNSTKQKLVIITSFTITTISVANPLRILSLFVRNAVIH